jgi:predicted Zn-dependent protease
MCFFFGWVFSRQGNVAFKSGDYEAALEHYLEASRTDPASPAIYTNCAQAFLKLGKFEEAAEKVRVPHSHALPLAAPSLGLPPAAQLCATLKA